MKRTLTILSSELDGTPLIRDYALARMLQAEFDVHLVGFSRTGEVWGPLASDPELDYRPFRCASAWEFMRRADDIADTMVEGDLLYAMKLRLTSFGLGQRIRRRLCKPLLLDIDDWQMGFLGTSVTSVYREFCTHGVGWFRDPLSPLYTRWLDRRIDRADAVTVTTGLLQDRYHGEWIPHTRDAQIFRPDLEPLPLPGDDGRKTVLFLGNVQPHKGLVVLLDAWEKMKRRDARLCIVGTPPNSRHLAPLRDRGLADVHFEGLVPFADVARIIASADLVVIPQLSTRGSWGQLPTKLIEAMAVGRAVISTAVGDIPRWLEDGAGVVVPPGDPQALAGAIEELLADDSRRAALGRAARARFLQHAAASVVQSRLLALVHDVIAGRPRPAPAPPLSAG